MMKSFADIPAGMMIAVQQMIVLVMFAITIRMDDPVQGTANDRLRLIAF